MEEIYIAGHSNRKGTLAALLEKRPNEFDAVVFTNYEYPLPTWIAPKVKGLLHIECNDVTVTYDQLDGMTPHKAPRKEQVEKILAWGKGKPKIVVACHAGVSRSSASAYLLACQAWGPGPALGVLRPQTHWPNPLIVKLGSEVLGNPEIWSRYVEWYNDACGVDPETDFGDDIQSDVEHIKL